MISIIVSIFFLHLTSRYESEAEYHILVYPTRDSVIFFYGDNFTSTFYNDNNDLVIIMKEKDVIGMYRLEIVD